MAHAGRLLRLLFGEEAGILENASTQSLIAASSVLVTGTMLLSPLIADLAVVFGVSQTRSGWMIVGYTAAAALTLPLVGALADQAGRKPLLVGGLLVFGTTGAAVGLVPVFEVALALRVLQGVGYALAMPMILTLFGDLYRGSRETTAQGVRVSVNSILSAIVPLLAGVLFVSSWRYPFALYLLAIPTAVWIWATVPRTGAAVDASFLTYAREMRSFLADAQIALLMSSFLIRFVLFYGLVTYVSVLAIEAAGMAVVAVGALLTVQGLLKTASSAQAGRLSLSYDPISLAVVSFATLTAGTVLMGAIPTPAMLVVGIAVWGVGDGLLAPCHKSLVNQLSPDAYRGGANTTALIFQNVGKVVGPLGLGVLLGVVGPAPAFVVLGAVAGGLGTASMVGVWLCDQR